MLISKFLVLVTGIVVNLSHIQQIIGINPAYALLFLKNKISIYECLFLSIVFSFFIFQSFSGGFIIIDYLQIIIDLSLGFMIFNMIRSTKNEIIERSLNKFSNLFIFLAVLSIIDYYYLGKIINGFFTFITAWPNEGEMTILPRLSLTFGNPNWAAFTTFFFLVISYFINSSNHLKFKLLILIFFFQSKSAIFISLFFIIFNSKNGILKSLLFSSASIIIYIAFSDSIGIEETASFFNRFVMYEKIIPMVDFYPKGLLSDYQIRSISNFSEDTLPSFLTLLYGVGWVNFILIFLYTFFKSLNDKFNFSVAACLFAFSVVYSFLTVSIVSAIGFTMLILSLYKQDSGVK
jgi:hypothetical protein